jgi:hypothetical protein
MAAGALVAAAAGCATKPDIRQDHDPTANFRAYRTFAFYDEPHGRVPYTSLLDTRLRQAARAQMETHNYVYSEPNPDLRVNLQLKVIDKQELRSTPGARGYRGWSAIETVEYRKGTLAVDVVDTQRNALVWRGVAESRLDAKAIEQPGTAVDAAVTELFAYFPAGKTK